MSWSRRLVDTARVDVAVPRVVGKARPRFTRSGRAYTPRGTLDAERLIRGAFAERYGGRFSGFRGPVSVTVEVERELARSNPAWHIGRTDTMLPDADNVLKLAIDALNGLAWADDRQAFYASVHKRDRVAHGKGSLISIDIHYYEETYRKD